MVNIRVYSLVVLTKETGSMTYSTVMALKNGQLQIKILILHVIKVNL